MVMTAGLRRLVVTDPFEAFFIDPHGQLIGPAGADDDYIAEHRDLAEVILTGDLSDYVKERDQYLYELLRGGWIRLGDSGADVAMEALARPSTDALATLRRITWGADRAQGARDNTLYYDLVPVDAREDDAVSGRAERWGIFLRALDRAYPAGAGQRLQAPHRTSSRRTRARAGVTFEPIW